MTGIARFVQDKDLKKILRATDGLGTEATRAGIIELLFKRGFLSKKGRYIHSSEAGRALIHSLPEIGRRPDMTAHWESVLTQISEKQCRYQDFMQPLVGTLYQLIDQARSTPVRQFRGLVAPGGAKKSFSKGKGKPKGKKRQTIPRRRRSNPPVVARMRYPTATASPPVRPMVYTKQPGRAWTRGP